MHIVKFQGGFANQLFQLCLYKRLVENYGTNCVFADISHYITNNDHGGFKLKDKYELRYIDKLPEKFVYVSETNFDTVGFSSDINYYYNGYWQSECFFPDNIDFIYDILDKSGIDEINRKILTLIEDSQSVSIHVRRGDYTHNPFHGNIANLTYINNAVSYIKEHVNNPTFFVFSDDIPWCKENITFDDVEVCYITGNEDNVEFDMLMMSRCKHNIIANSSFSWWAQRLNKNENKIVIAPEYWFNENGNFCIPEQTGFVHVKNIPRILRFSQEPVFSIIVNFKSNEIYLRRFLESVLNQTFECIEVIVIDGSDDNMHKLLMDYASHNIKIRIVNSKGLFCGIRGITSALRSAKGKYVYLANSNEIFVEEYWSNINAELDDLQSDRLVKKLFKINEKGIMGYVILYSINATLCSANESVNKTISQIRKKLRH